MPDQPPPYRTKSRFAAGNQCAKRLVIIVAILVAALLSACGGSKEAPVVVPEGAQAGDLALEPCSYEAREVEYAADCGTLVVPENRSDPGSRLIALPVTRINAIGGNPAEPIFHLGGGPGVTNMAFSQVGLFIEKHDLVLVGYRGVDGSARLDCPEVSQAFSSGAGNLVGEESLRIFADAYAACARRLQVDGIDTDGYIITEVITDLEAARVGLGYERVNLLSGSYGTRLAMLYAWMHSNRIRRSAMIGVNPPGHFVWQAEVIDEQIAYYANLCRQDTACSSRTDDLTQLMRDLSHNMPERWLFFPIDGGLVKVATFNALGDTAQAPLALDLWLSAAEGDPSGMALITLAGPFLFSGATVWGENAAKVTSADFEFTSMRECIAALDPPDTVMGSPFSLLGCSAIVGWPYNRIPDELREVQTSDVETLLVSGSIDFLTPAQFAVDELLPNLTNGQSIVLSEFGHVADVYNRQPEATIRLLTSFFDTGVADDSLYSHQPVNFDVGLGFPTMAKIALAILVLGVALVF